ncbi:20574_t:CDS:2 [Gigaspora margarita]|uniref:20574_t:CDS:1 n=1 Tax=Gigaspora margarita TaxID=4874 RepID=A0ABM8W0T7_GIGMA|nr:20574_t:CDS:2 [Gigaspora margarita]
MTSGNTIFGIRFNNSKDPNDGSDLSYWTNCKSMIFQLWCFFNTIPCICLYPIREMQLKEEESRLPFIHAEEHKNEK